MRRRCTITQKETLLRHHFARVSVVGLDYTLRFHTHE
jgi:hypothetical protein